MLVCESAHCTRIAVFAANNSTTAAVAALPTLRCVAALNCVVNANYLLFYSRSNVVVVAAFPKSRNEKIEKHILKTRTDDRKRAIAGDFRLCKRSGGRATEHCMREDCTTQVLQ